MKHLFTITCIVITGCAFSQTASAQIHPTGGISLNLGLPQGEFNDNVSSVGFGANLYGALGFGQSPVSIGAELGFLIYGHERRNEPFSTTIPDVTVDVVTDNNIALGHLFVRLQPPTGAVRPYADALVGLKYFFTRTRIENEGFGDDEAIAASTNFDDTAFSYGLGMGLDIPVWTGAIGEDRNMGTVMINLGMRYLWGTEADYLKEGSVRRSNGRVAYDITRSDTSLLIPQLGVTFRF